MPTGFTPNAEHSDQKIHTVGISYKPIPQVVIKVDYRNRDAAKALLSEGASWLVRFVHPGFAYAKIAGFLLLQTSLAVLVGVSLWAVFAGSQRYYGSTPDATS